MIAIIDFGMGNLGSVYNMFKWLGYHDAIITADLEQIKASDKLVLPGVGSYKMAMDNLKNGGYLPILEQKVNHEHVPCMGICLGMQLLFERSEEGDCDGLGYIKGKVVRFNFDNEEKKIRIPHIGWNFVDINKKSAIVEDMFSENRFYFVHSYHAKCEDEEDILMTTNYGYNFASAVEKNNIYGFQFHPEKSHKYGKKIFENFLKI